MGFLDQMKAALAKKKGQQTESLTNDQTKDTKTSAAPPARVGGNKPQKRVTGRGR